MTTCPSGRARPARFWWQHVVDAAADSKSCGALSFPPSLGLLLRVAADSETLEGYTPTFVSFSFSLRLDEPPPISVVIDALREPHWACTEELPLDDQWSSGSVIHPFVKGKSARGVEVSFEDGRFQVRILTCSSRADYVLGLRLVDVLATLGRSTVTPEDGKPMARELLAARYDHAWIEQMVDWGPEAIMKMVETDAQTLTMSGAVREVHVGPRFVSDLRARKGDMTAEQQLLAAMVRIQNIDVGRWYAASAFRVTPRGKGEADAVTLAAWAPDVAYLFPSVQFFAIVAQNGTDVLVTNEHAAGLAGDRWTWLDEKNALCEAVPQADWGAFVLRAREHAVRML